MKAAILAKVKIRLSFLLKTNSPEVKVKKVTRKMATLFKINLDSDYSVAEDLAMQLIIQAYEDDELDGLWTAYNVGYFKEDTDHFKKLLKGESYEGVVNLIVSSISSRSN